MFHRAFNRRTSSALILVVVLGLAATGLRIALSSEPSAEKTKVTDPLRPQKEELLFAARDWLARLQQRENAGEPLRASFVELRASIVQRVFEAELMLAETAERRIAAAEAYVKSRRATLDVLKHRIGQDVTSTEIAQQTYFVKEAELRLAELKQAADPR